VSAQVVSAEDTYDFVPDQLSPGLIQAIDKWHSDMDPGVLMTIAEGVRKMQMPDGSPYRFTLGSGFSGCSILTKIANRLFEFWNNKYGINVQLDECYQCDSGHIPQPFLMAEHADVKCLFRTVEELAEGRAFDLKSGSYQVVPFTKGWGGGFCCQTKSSFDNSSSKEHRSSAVQDEVGKTGEAWRATKQFLKAKRPPVIFLENLENLANCNDAGVSDAQCIIAWLSETGYVCQYFLVNAKDYGACDSRPRCYIIGYLGSGSSASMAVAQYILPNLKITPVALESMIGKFQDIPHLWRDAAADELELQPKRCLKKDPEYEDQHFSYYKAVALEYPPDLCAAGRELALLCANISQREAEVFYYAEQVEPYPDAPGISQFADLNLSMKYHLGSAGKGSIFHESIPCLATSSDLVMRVQFETGEKCFRLIKGKYLLRLIGYGDPLPGSHADPKTCSHLTGDAFNGFACSAAVLAALVGFGQGLAT
jgi:site-specific DNA-cytosine methylase